MIEGKLSYEECHKEINGVLHKLCKICEEWFPANLENFYPKKSKEGLSPYCKKCESNKNHQWQVDNRERYNTYYKDNSSPKMIQYYRELSKKRRENGEYKKWQQNNKDKLKEYGEYRELHKKHTISKKEWTSCKEYFNNCCAYCGLPIEEHFNVVNGELKLTDFHKEHFNHQGENDLSNCVPSCKTCNSSKRAKAFDEWYSNQDFYNKDRIIKIHKWLGEDYKLYIKESRNKSQ